MRCKQPSHPWQCSFSSTWILRRCGSASSPPPSQARPKPTTAKLPVQPPPAPRPGSGARGATALGFTQKSSSGPRAHSFTTTFSRPTTYLLIPTNFSNAACSGSPLFRRSRQCLHGWIQGRLNDSCSCMYQYSYQYRSFSNLHQQRSPHGFCSGPGPLGARIGRALPFAQWLAEALRTRQHTPLATNASGGR